MKTTFLTLLSILSVAPAFINAKVYPGADIPEFYLVSSSSGSSSNLKPLRNSGGSNGGSSLKGTSPIGIFFFYQGKFVSLEGSDLEEAYISATPIAGGCSTYGPLAFNNGGSNKCAQRGDFRLQSNEENSQLGAKLARKTGAFYDCGNKGVWYKEAPGDGGQTCTEDDLYTVPVV